MNKFSRFLTLTFALGLFVFTSCQKKTCHKSEPKKEHHDCGNSGNNTSQGSSVSSSVN